MAKFDASFAFYMDAKLKKRYFYLKLHKHVSQNFMGDRLRAEFERVVVEAEREAGYADNALKAEQARTVGRAANQPSSAVAGV